MSTTTIPEICDEEYIISEGKRFILIYQPNFDYKDEEAGPYQVVNKTTGVIEFENKVLAGVMEMLIKFELALDIYEKQLAELSAPEKHTSPDGEEDKKLKLVRQNLKLTPIDQDSYRQITEEEFAALFGEDKDD